MDLDRAVVDDVKSVEPAIAQGTAQADSQPTSGNQESEAKQAFFKMMNDRFTQYIRTNPAIQQPPPPINPFSMPAVPQINDLLRSNKPLVDKIRKHGAEEFKATDDDDVERAEFWLDNTIRVFDKLSCTPKNCLKCEISLLRDTTYHWWNTLVSVVPKERVT